MRVLIMSDMEGVSGIVVWEQVNGGAPLYEESRRLYTEEINAAVRGANDPWLIDVVQAYTSVAVFFDLDRTNFQAVAERLRDLPGGDARMVTGWLRPSARAADSCRISVSVLSP